MPCTSKGIALLLGAHLDGQLDPVKTLEVEAHLAACEVCRERLALDRALRGSLKKAVATSAPNDMRARMLAAMAGEAARELANESAHEETSASRTSSEIAADAAAESESASLDSSASREATGAGRHQRPSMLRHWRTMLPLASAAALVMAWGAASKQPVVHGMPVAMVPAGLPDDLLRDFVGQHSHSLPPEQQDPKQVRQFERHIGVPVHVPQFGQNAHFVGGRLVPLHGGQRAAMLQFEMKQGTGSVQRVTVFVYDPRNVRVGGANLVARAVGTAEVRVGQEDGYSVAVMQHGGVGYTIASDLDPETSANLVAVVDHD